MSQNREYLLVLAVALATVAGLAVDHVIPSQATITLLGVIFTHAGITAHVRGRGQ